MKSPRVALLAIAVLALCCIFWGMSFPLMQIGCDSVERAVAPQLSLAQRLGVRATFNGWRFGLAAVAYWLITRRQQRGFTRAECEGGVVVGTFFALGMFPQIVGLRYVRASVSGFLTSLCVIFAPLAQGLLFRRTVGARTWLAVAVAVVGIALLSQEQSDSSQVLVAAPPVPYFGEAITILASVLFTGQILSVDYFGQKADAVRLTLVMFATTSVLSAGLGVGLAGPGIYEPSSLEAIARSREFWVPLVVLVLVCSVVAIHLMNRFQPMVSPATASVVYCLEPVFATLFSVLFRTERLISATIWGGAMVLLAVGIVAARPARADAAARG